MPLSFVFKLFIYKQCFNDPVKQEENWILKCWAFLCLSLMAITNKVKVYCTTNWRKFRRGNVYPYNHTFNITYIRWKKTVKYIISYSYKPFFAGRYINSNFPMKLNWKLGKYFCVQAFSLFPPHLLLYKNNKMHCDSFCKEDIIFLPFLENKLLL